MAIYSIFITIAFYGRVLPSLVCSSRSVVRWLDTVAWLKSKSVMAIVNLVWCAGAGDVPGRSLQLCAHGATYER
ncbi:unnamed protein product, partial [Brenthis ino]